MCDDACNADGPALPSNLSPTLHQSPYGKGPETEPTNTWGNFGRRGPIYPNARKYRNAKTPPAVDMAGCQGMSSSLTRSSRSFLSPCPAQTVAHRVIAFMKGVLEYAVCGMSLERKGNGPRTLPRLWIGE